MKQTAVAPPDHLIIPPDVNGPCDPILGIILSHCVRESNAQLFCYVLTCLFAPPAEEPVDYEALRLSNERLAEVHRLDVWRNLHGYSFIDEAFAMYEAMLLPDPVWYEKSEYFQPWNRPLTELERLALPEMYARYYAKHVKDDGEGYQWLLHFATYTIAQPVRNNGIFECTQKEREELYRLRAHMLAKWRTVLPNWQWCEPGTPIRLLTDTAGRCVHGLLSFGWTTEGELIEDNNTRTNDVRDQLLRGEDGQVLMCLVGNKGSDHSRICQACVWNYGAFTDKPLNLFPEQDQERWLRVRPKGSRKQLSDRWGLATGTESAKSGTTPLTEVKELSVRSSGAQTGKRVFDTPRLRYMRWNVSWKGFYTRPSGQLFTKPNGPSSTYQGTYVLVCPLQERIVKREQLAEDFFGMHNPITKEEYLDLYQSPRNGVSFVPYALRQARLLGDDQGLPSLDSWLTQRNTATRYVKALKPQGEPPTDMYEGYGPVASRWCEKCVEYFHQDHKCAAVDRPTTKHATGSHLDSVLRKDAKDREQVRLSLVTEYLRELKQCGHDPKKLLDLRAQRAAVWSLSTGNDIDTELVAQWKMGLVHDSLFINGGKRVSTASAIGEKLEKEDWSMGVRQGEAGWNHSFSDQSSADRRHKSTRTRWKLENKFSTITHCAHCGRRFAGRKGADCCTFDCADEFRNGKKSNRTKGEEV